MESTNDPVQARITCAEAAIALDEMDDLARMDIGVDGVGPREVLAQFIREVIEDRSGLAHSEGLSPLPRNRSEAAALAKQALAYLGVIDAHIDAAIARCETDVQSAQEQGA